MKKEQFYSVVIILLLLLNMGTLGYLWVNRQQPQAQFPGNAGPGHPEPDRIIIDRLQLDATQQEQFAELKHIHRKSTDSLQQLISHTQHELFRLVRQDEMDIVLRDSLLAQIEHYETAKHIVTIQHFYDLRKILNEQQKESFNGFMEEIGSRITGPGRGHHGPPPPGH